MSPLPTTHRWILQVARVSLSIGPTDTAEWARDSPKRLMISACHGADSGCATTSTTHGVGPKNLAIH